MASDNTGKPPRKKFHPAINFSLWLKVKKQLRMSKPRLLRKDIKKFLEKIFLQASYGNTNVVKLKERIGR